MAKPIFPFLVKCLDELNSYGKNLNQAHVLLPCKVIMSHDKKKNQLVCFQHLVWEDVIRNLYVLWLHSSWAESQESRHRHIRPLLTDVPCYSSPWEVGRMTAPMRRRKAVNRLLTKVEMLLLPLPSIFITPVFLPFANNSCQ